MPLRLMPWAPQYGTGMQLDSGAEEDPSQAEVDTSVERSDWVAVEPKGDPPAALQIVDGVRRAEAHAIDDGPEGEPLLGLFGSLAAGVVRCDVGSASIPEQHLHVGRRYLQAGGDPHDRTVPAGSTNLTFHAEVVRSAAGANSLLSHLNNLMLQAEAKLAESLSTDESILTFVDGPLHLRSPGRRVVGYVKRIHTPYVDVERLNLLTELSSFQRSPLFLISDRQNGYVRYAWYLRLANLDRLYHPLAGIIRLEAPGVLPLVEAARLADQSAQVLPRLASSPTRDPRAPQNLTPVGALEAALTHRLGDRLRIRRLIATALGAELPAPATVAGGTRW